MHIVDDRTPAQRLTHPWLVVGTDPWMTSLGRDCGKVPPGGSSFCAWAVPTDPDHTEYSLRQVETWAKNRGDLLRVRTVYDTPARPYNPSCPGHLHIYVAQPDVQYRPLGWVTPNPTESGR